MAQFPVAWYDGRAKWPRKYWLWRRAEWKIFPRFFSKIFRPKLFSKNFVEPFLEFFYFEKLFFIRNKIILRTSSNMKWIICYCMTTMNILNSGRFLQSFAQMKGMRFHSMYCHVTICKTLLRNIKCMLRNKERMILY